MVGIVKRRLVVFLVGVHRALMVLSSSSIEIPTIFVILFFLAVHSFIVIIQNMSGGFTNIFTNTMSKKIKCIPSP